MQPLRKYSHFERSMAKRFNRRQNIGMISAKLDWISQKSHSYKIIWIRSFQIYDTCLKGSHNFIRYFETEPLKKSSEIERIMQKTIDRCQNTSLMTV